MRLLLDTHVLLALPEPTKASVPSSIHAMLKSPENESYLSVVSLWEVAIKTRLGKLALSLPIQSLLELVEDLGITILSVNADHALAEVEPKPLTRDPFDNMLLAQCQVEGLRLLTMDRALVAHPLASGLALPK